MSLLGTELESITLAHLRALIDNAVGESRYIEYKADLAFAEASEKIKFVAGLSAFANSDGGDMIIGIRAVNGIPQELIGISVEGADRVKLVLEQLMQMSVSPRMVARIQEISLDASRKILIIRIPRSWALPHRVIFQGHDKFYGRNSAGKFPMDVDQLRAAFLFSSNLNDQIEKKRQMMLDEIIRVPVAEHFGTSPLLILHMIPYSVLDPSRVIDIQKADSLASRYLIPLGPGQAQYRRFTVDGILSCSDETHLGVTRMASYVQLFRSGMIEAVATGRHGAFSSLPPNMDTKIIASTLLVQQVLHTCEHAGELLSKLQVGLPLVIMLSMLNAKGYILADQQLYSSQSIDRNSVLIQPVVINKFEEDLYGSLRPLFDTLWNAANLPACTLYTSGGIPTFRRIDRNW